MKHANEKSFLTQSLRIEAYQQSWKPVACTVWKMDVEDLYHGHRVETGIQRHYSRAYTNIVQ